MAASLPLESSLEDIFIKKAPKLPAGGKKFIVDLAPWFALIIGVLTLLVDLQLWHWAHFVSSINSLALVCNTSLPGSTAGCGPTSRLSAWVWLTLIVITIEGILYLVAFPGLRDKKRIGWNYLYYGALLNVVYAVVNLFTSYDVVGNFIGALIGSAIGFWLLFQIRDAYKAMPAPKNSK